MIHGEGVGAKYHVIIEGRKSELLRGVTPATFQTKTDELMEFKQMIRQCNMAEFNEWYEIYKETFKPLPERRRRTIVEDLQDHDD